MPSLFILKRRKPSGFVLWPKNWAHRLLSGRARYQTKCDMLVGPCSCGYTHRENECDTVEMLERYNCEIEIQVLTPKDGEVKIPKYWSAIIAYNRRRCTHLVGVCMCGQTHKATDSRIIELLKEYRTMIADD